MQVWQLALIELRNTKASKALGCILRAWLLKSYAKLPIYCVLLPYELYHQREAISSSEKVSVSLFVSEEKTVWHCYL